jgi:hypothetical protein
MSEHSITADLAADKQQLAEVERLLASVDALDVAERAAIPQEQVDQLKSLRTTLLTQIEMAEQTLKMFKSLGATDVVFAED